MDLEKTSAEPMIHCAPASGCAPNGANGLATSTTPPPAITIRFFSPEASVVRVRRLARMSRSTAKARVLLAAEKSKVISATGTPGG
ncbi:hypothetical protein D3C81_1978170 [compost metagenome]